MLNIVSKEMQIKTAMTYHFTYSRMAKNKKMNYKFSFSWQCAEIEYSFTLWKSLAVVQKVKHTYNPTISLIAIPHKNLYMNVHSMFIATLLITVNNGKKNQMPNKWLREKQNML